jgi:hypothetical protein
MQCLVRHLASTLRSHTVHSCVVLSFSTLLSVAYATVTLLLNEKAIISTYIRLPDICLFHKSASVQYCTGL